MKTSRLPNRRRLPSGPTLTGSCGLFSQGCAACAGLNAKASYYLAIGRPATFMIIDHCQAIIPKIPNDRQARNANSTRF